MVLLGYGRIKEPGEIMADFPLQLLEKSKNQGI
jgi:hypothetical protein